jgi:hypothetical protein
MLTTCVSGLNNSQEVMAGRLPGYFPGRLPQWAIDVFHQAGTGLLAWGAFPGVALKLAPDPFIRREGVPMQCRYADQVYER